MANSRRSKTDVKQIIKFKATKQGDARRKK